MYKALGLSVAAVALASVTFWTTLVTDPPATEAETLSKFNIGDVLKSAAQDAPTQDAGVIACTYVLRDGHRCD